MALWLLESLDPLEDRLGFQLAALRRLLRLDPLPAGPLEDL